MPVTLNTKKSKDGHYLTEKRILQNRECTGNWRKAHKPERAAYAKKWRGRNKRYMKVYRKMWYQKHKARLLPKVAAYRKSRDAALKIEFLAAYGGKCTCCGESRAAFLTMEHTRRDGAEHRRRVGATVSCIYVDLKKQGWPKDGYTIYCMNCNWATRLGKACPHVESN